MKMHATVPKKGVRIWLLFALMASAAGCVSTFTVSKYCTTYYFGSTQDGLHKMLCESGDLLKVLNDSGLPRETQDAFSRFQCVDRSHDGVVKTYAVLSGEQKMKLLEAFKKQGYEINSKPASNFHVFPLDIDPNFCSQYENK